jgi:hypothetical protein
MGFPMPFRPPALACALFAALAAAVTPAVAATKAIVLVGLAGEQMVWEDFEAERAGWEEGLAANGIETKVIVSAQGNDDATPRDAFRKQALEAFAAWKSGLTAQDDAILVLIGHGNTKGERFVFQNRGERLKKEDFAVLKDLPARSLLAVLSGPGGIGLVEELRGPKNTILSATMLETEINHAKFGTFLATQVAAKPAAPLLELFRAAAEHTFAYYDAQTRAQTEHAILFLAKDEKGIEPPFDLGPGDPRIEALPRWTLAAPALGATPVTEVAAVTPSDLPAAIPPPPEPAPPKETELGTAPRDLQDLGKLPVDWRLLKDSAQIDEVPYISFRDATPEEQALFKEVPPASEFPEAPGVMMRHQMRLEVKDKYAWSRSIMTRLYVRNMSVRPLIDNLYSPPMAGLATIKYLRTISPSGKVVEVQPDALANFARSAGGGVMLFPPGVEPGVIIECEISEAGPAPPFNAFYEEQPVTFPMVPTTSKELVLTTPRPDYIRTKLYGGFPGEHSQEKLAYSHRQTWKWEKLPPSDLPEAGAPSVEDPTPRLAMTSYRDWSEFLGWYQSLMRDVRNSSELIKDKAAELAKDQPDETAKVKAVYDYVNELRYITIVGGANSWRPRNPTTTLARQFGDCKDKANLVIALLHEMGIKANFVLLTRGGNFDPEVPTFAFNHAIAVLPGKKPGDAWTWLDATDTSTPFGMLPPGDADRWGFVITGEEAKDYEIKKITGYQGEFKAESRVEITLNKHDPATGQAEGTVSYAPAGMELYEWAQMMRGASPQQVRQQLVATFLKAWPECEPQEVRLVAGPGTSKPKADPLFEATIGFNLGRGERMELPRPLWQFDKEVAVAAWERTTPLELNEGYRQTFVQVLKLAPGILEELTVGDKHIFLPIAENSKDPEAPSYLDAKLTMVTEQEPGKLPAIPPFDTKLPAQEPAPATKPARVARITSTLRISEPTVPTDRVAGARGVLRTWVKYTDGTDPDRWADPARMIKLDSSAIPNQ